METRLFLVVAFAGTRYAGWQYQDNADTVQGHIWDAVEELLGGKARPVPLSSSRTDTGVHADFMPLHLDLPEEDRPSDRWRLGLNHKLPWDIRIMHAAYVPQEFHARKSAICKTYAYRFWMRGEAPPRWAPYVWQRHQIKDWAAAQHAAQIFLGEHDFSSFLIPEPDQGTVRTIQDIAFEQEGPLMTMRVTGPAFARRMIRFLAGGVAAVGRKDISVEELGKVLEARDNQLAPAVAEAKGLTLEKVFYPESFAKYLPTI